MDAHETLRDCVEEFSSDVDTAIDGGEGSARVAQLVRLRDSAQMAVEMLNRLETALTPRDHEILDQFLATVFNIATNRMLLIAEKLAVVDT